MLFKFAPLLLLALAEVSLALKDIDLSNYTTCCLLINLDIPTDLLQGKTCSVKKDSDLLKERDEDAKRIMKEAANIDVTGAEDFKAKFQSLDKATQQKCCNKMNETKNEKRNKHKDEIITVEKAKELVEKNLEVQKEVEGPLLDALTSCVTDHKDNQTQQKKCCKEKVESICGFESWGPFKESVKKIFEMDEE